MANNTEKYTTVIELNAEQAKNNLNQLHEKVRQLVAEREKVDKKTQPGYYAYLTQQIKAAKGEIKSYNRDILQTIDTLQHISTASAQSVGKAMDRLKQMINQVPRGSELHERLTRQFNQTKQELENIKNLRAFEAVQKGITGTGKSARQLDAEFSFLKQTIANIGTVSEEQLRKALEVAQSHHAVAKQGSERYKASTEQIMLLKARLAEMDEEQKRVVTTVEKYNAELARAGQTSGQVATASELIERTLGALDSAPVRDVQYAMQMLNEEMAGMDTSSDVFKQRNADLGRMKQRLAEITAEQKKAKTTIDQYDEAIRRAEKSLEQTEREAQLVNGTLKNLSTARVVDLEFSIKLLNEELMRTERGTAKARELTKQIEKLRSELDKVRYAASGKQSWFNRTADFFNKLQGTVIVGIAGLGKLRDIANGSTEAFASMDQEMANVRKYTGQTTEEVKALNEEFKRINTRTPREQLNQLAGAAGRLGEKGTQAVKEFVDASDIINLAMRDDLGDNAVEQIGKLAKAFGEDRRMGLRGAMLATGSAVNELSQNTASNAGYLVDFAARLSGVGQQAGLTQAHIMGLGAVMDENMQRDEMASTALSQIITKMVTDTETFARMAGKPVEEFSRLVREDMNGALIEFFTAMQRRGGFTQLAPLFDEMKLDGTRATQVLSVLAAKVDDVRKYQEMATEAYREGNSVVKEAAIQNNTNQARLEKARKAFNEIRIELGEKLLPVVGYTMTSVGALVKVLNTLISFTATHIKQLAIVATAVAVTTAAYKAHSVWVGICTAAEKALNAVLWLGTVATKARIAAVGALRIAYLLLTGQVGRLTAALRLMRIAGLANPMGAMLTMALSLAGAVWAVTSAFSNLSRRIRENTMEYRINAAAAKAIAKDTKDIGKAVNDSVGKEVSRINHLTNVMRSNVYSINQRKWAIAELQRIVPGFHASITNEGVLIEKNSGKLTDYISNLKKAALAQAYMSKLAEITTDKLNAQLEEERKRNNLRAVDAEMERGERMGDKNPYKSQKKTTYIAGAGPGSSGYYVEQEQNEVLIKKQKEREAQEKAVNAAVEKRLVAEQREKELLDSMAKNGIAPEATVKGNAPTVPTIMDVPPADGDSGSDTDEKSNEYQAKAAAIKAAYDQAKLDLQRDLMEMEVTEDEYHRQGYLNEQQYLASLLALQEEYGESTIDTESKILTNIANEASRQKAVVRQEMNEALATAEDAYNRDQIALSQMRARGEIATDEELSRRKQELERDYWQQRLSIIRQYGGDTTQAEMQLAQLELQQFQTAEQQKTEIAKQEAEKRKVIQEAFMSAGQDMLSSASSLFQAMENSETAAIEARYKKQIDAAKKAGKDTTKLEEKKEKEINAIKKKYAQKEFMMKVLQITADTAVGIAQLWKNPGYPWAIPLTALVAASGAMQLATAKKAQQQAESEGYYEGGYTGGRRYRKEAGVVHEGEFVANHLAVENPQLRPVLDLIDMAQRNNTIGTLTAADVSRSVGGGNGAAVVAPVVNVTTDNTELAEHLDQNTDVLQRLIVEMRNLKAKVVIQELREEERHYDTLLRYK